MQDEPKPTPSRSIRIGRLAASLKDDEFRDAYLSRKIKSFLAAQIRALRGPLTQIAFGKEIGKPQSVISRLEKENLKGVHLQTLIDIAKKKKVGLLIRFVPFQEFIKYTDDYSDKAIAPEPYDHVTIDALAEQELAESRDTLGTQAYNFFETMTQSIKDVMIPSNQATATTALIFPTDVLLSTNVPALPLGSGSFTSAAPPFTSESFASTLSVLPNANISTVALGSVGVSNSASLCASRALTSVMTSAIPGVFQVIPSEKIEQTRREAALREQLGRTNAEKAHLMEQNEKLRLALLSNTQQARAKLWQRQARDQAQGAPGPT